LVCDAWVYARRHQGVVFTGRVHVDDELMAQRVSFTGSAIVAAVALAATPTWTPARNSCRSCSLIAKDKGEGCHDPRTSPSEIAFAESQAAYRRISAHC
jgi:hypothetical protein